MSIPYPMGATPFQYADNSANNAMRVLQAIQNIVRYYANCGQMTPQEANHILATANQPQGANRIAIETRNMYGVNMVGDAEIQNLAQRFVYKALNNMRSQHLGMPCAQLPSAAAIPTGGYTQCVSAPYIPSDGVADSNDLYGSQVTSADQMLSGTPTPAPSQMVIQNRPVTQATVAQPQVTNSGRTIIPDQSIYNVGINEDNSMPEFTSIQMPQPRDKEIFKNYGFTIGDRALMTIGTENIHLMEISLTDPYTARENMIEDVMSMTNEASPLIHTEAMFPILSSSIQQVEIGDTGLSFTERTETVVTESVQEDKSESKTDKPLAIDLIPTKFVLPVDWEQLKIIDTPSRNAMTAMANIANLVASGNTKVLTDILKSIQANGKEFESVVSKEFLNEFNHAARVCFMKPVPNSTAWSTISPLETLKDFQDLYSNSGKFEEWKEDADTFKQRLSSCLKVTIGRIFSKTRKLYLNPESGTDYSYIVTSEQFRARIHGISGRKYAMTSRNEQADKFFKAKSFSCFSWLINRKVLLHNLDIPSIVNCAKPGAAAMFPIHDPVSTVFYELFSKYGPFMCIDVRKKEDWINPLMVGVSYTNQPMARRILV